MPSNPKIVVAASDDACQSTISATAVGFQYLVCAYLLDALAALDGSSVALAGTGHGRSWCCHCDGGGHRVVAPVNDWVGGGDRKEGKCEHGHSGEAREHHRGMLNLRGTVNVSFAVRNTRACC